jgi:hypothetical protein
MAVVKKLGIVFAKAREARRWQNIPGSVFAVLFEWRPPGSRKPWVIVIADHAVRGQVDRSMLSPSGSQMP